MCLEGKPTVSARLATRARDVILLAFGIAVREHILPIVCSAIVLSIVGTEYLPVRGEENSSKPCETASGTQLRVHPGHSSTVNSVAFSLDGKQVLTGSSDDTARLWDAA